MLYYPWRSDTLLPFNGICSFCHTVSEYVIWEILKILNLLCTIVRWPWGVNFSEPESQGLVGTRNFYLETEPGVKIGVWHTLPKSLVGELSDTEYNEEPTPENTHITVETQKTPRAKPNLTRATDTEYHRPRRWTTESHNAPSNHTLVITDNNT